MIEIINMLIYKVTFKGWSQKLAKATIINKFNTCTLVIQLTCITPNITTGL